MASGEWVLYNRDQQMVSENLKELTLEVLKDLRADMGGLRAWVGELRAEASGMRSDLNELRTEVGELRIEMRGEFARVSDELRKVREELGVGFQAMIQKDDRRFNDQQGRLRVVEPKTGRRRRRPT